ncbi:MAG: tryptophan halogenase family protein [Hyphomonas sp.]
MLSPDTLSHIVIAGGGTAGWMTAAALSRMTGNGHTRITLVESEEIGTVGVGEATIPPINMFNRLLGIDENDFIRATQATFKLGIEFQGWLREGHAYLHPFGEYGLDLNAVKFYQFWLKLKALGREVGSLEEYCLSAVAARHGRFAPPDPDPRTVQSAMAYAFHFDAGLYAAYLRRYSEARGVRRIEGRIGEVQQRAEDGFVTALKLASGETIEGDLFIDCTGFRALLIGETLGVGYEDWSHWLPVDRALAVPSANTGAPIPYTKSIARPAGWQWRIPLQHRTGNGHVWCSAFMDEADAARILMQNLEGPALAEPRPLRFRTGRRTEFWNRNVVAIGLSGGFLEPLESTSIHLIQAGISKLIALMPDKRFDPAERATYNRLTAMQFEQVRDFIILHYKATERTGPFWDYVRTMEVPETLQQRIDLFRSKGRIFRFEDELFGEANWLSVLMGQGITPRAWDPVADTVDLPAAERQVAGIRAAIRETALRLPTHQQYIDRFCAAPQHAFQGVS